MGGNCFSTRGKQQYSHGGTHLQAKEKLMYYVQEISIYESRQ